MYEENQAVVLVMTRNETNFRTKSKHVRVRHNFPCEQAADGEVICLLSYI